FVYYGAEDATDIIIAMGSVNETIKEVVDHLTTKENRKVGLVVVHLFRPFSAEHLLKVLPKTVKRIAVLERTKEQGSIGEPLLLDVQSVFYGKENAPLIIGGRYGLSSKDTNPAQIFAVYDNLAKGENAKKSFTIGIVDDVTFTSLDITNHTDVLDSDVSQLIFYGLGSDGTVGANKNTVKLIGDNTDNYAQAYFAYDSKKSGGVTRSHLRFSKNPIRSTYLVNKAGFISCSLDTYLEKYDMLKDLKENGRFLLNTSRSDAELIEFMPNSVKKTLAEKNAKLYVIDAITLAKEIGLGNRTNTILQSAFFKLNEQIMPFEKAKELMKKYAHKSYIKKGKAVVELNYKAIDLGDEGLREVYVDPAWANLEDEQKVLIDAPHFVQTLANPINAIQGNDLPVSAFTGYEDGTMTNGSAAFEKRYIASFVPEWVEENCIQCNQCSFVCPHAVIRPFLSTEDEQANAPENSQFLNPVGKGFEGLKYSIVVSIADCTGCESCVNTCPGRKGEKALRMVPIADAVHQERDKVAKYFFNEVTYKSDLVDLAANAKNSQFAQPLFEFHGACAGCGETPYIKLVTQLFGDRMVIANATGCSSIYGGSFPATPYTTNSDGQGPAWANSLFEDNAEFGFGMKIATEAIRSRMGLMMEKAIEENSVSEEIKELFQKWVDNTESSAVTNQVATELVPLLEKSDSEVAIEILKLKDYLVKRSQWIFGGDGWAYDIGFGGLDHVIASNEDINILVLDTEVYSNTGGQSSKSSQTGSIAKFTASGKPGKKKDLGAIAMSYGHVYVASISHGASQAQMLKAIREAESYNGPSLIIAYSPCIAHGIKGGMGLSQNQAKLAVECGYWTNYRFDPRLAEEGKNPFQLDSKEPDWDKYEDHLMSENRYAQIKNFNPEHAQKLLELNKKESQRRYNTYKRYQAMDYSI
ncbi:MAG: pyruvate:ferredoxin (flavodoxin) oxidoreductase, partial [Bacilli bacterium]